MDYKELWVVFFPRWTAGPKLVGSCCIRLHTTANTHATTPNIVGATMLGVVAPVCTQPYRKMLRQKYFVRQKTKIVKNSCKKMGWNSWCKVRVTAVVFRLCYQCWHGSFKLCRISSQSPWLCTYLDTNHFMETGNFIFAYYGPPLSHVTVGQN